MSSKFKCFLVGEGSLLLQCGEILLRKGHKISGIFSANRIISDWSAEKGINLYNPDSGLISVLESHPFDYLFSIANLSLLPAEVISLPSKMTINFHDGPLPQYAGINATSWALLNDEKTHGITWHRLTSGIDDGAIVNQKKFNISPDETAFTLNTKCYEAGAVSFNELIDDLESGKYHEIEQELKNRTYFSKHQKPESAGIISWNKSAGEISSLIRALNFGPYINPLASAKILIAGEPYIVKNAAENDPVNHKNPGIIIDYNTDSITVSTKNGSIILSDFETITGNKITAADILSKHKLTAGSSLNEPDKEWRRNLTAFCSEVCKNEPYFVERLKQFEPIDLPFRSSGDNFNPVFGRMKLEINGKAKDHINSQSEYSYESFIKSVFALFIGKLLAKVSYDLGYMPDLRSSGIESFESLFANVVPFHIKIDYTGNVSEQISKAVQSCNKVKKLKTYIKDLIARTPELKNNGARYSDYFVLIQDGELNGTGFSSNSKLILFYSNTEQQFHLVYNENIFSEEKVNKLVKQFNEFLINVISNYEKKFYEISLLTDEERDTLLKQWNNTKTDYNETICIHQLFEEQVKINPDSIAVVCNEEQITYNELNKRSDQLSKYLLSRGIRENDFVAVSLNRSIDMLAAILGVLKSGAAYVPVDPHFPRHRTAFMIEDSGCSFIITESSFKNNFDSSGAEVIYIDAEKEKISSTVYSNYTRSKSSDTAYMIYTSGSTGKPKGVMVSHKNVINFFTGIDQHVKYDNLSVWLAVTSLSFDISVLELLWTLTRGLKVVLYTGEDIKLTARTGKTSVSSGKIDFSLFYFSSYEGEKSGNKYKLLIEGARFGDKNDFAAIWTPERHFYDFGGLYANPSITSAAVSTITDKIKIRAGSVVSPLHSTIRIAEEWSMVDNLSQGRVAIAFAAGWQPNDFVIMPQNFDDRKDIMFRQVEEIQQLWKGESVSFKNPIGKMIDVRILPRPIQKKLPVWITAAGNPETFESAGRKGYNLLTHLLGQTINEVSEKIKIYRSAWKEAGHEGEGTITLMLHTFVGTGEASVKETVREPMKNYLRSAVNLVKEAAWSFPTFKQATTNAEGNFSMDQLSAEDLDAVLDYSFERYYQTSGLFGTPKSCLKMVEDLKQTGVDEIACLIDFGIDSDIVLAHLHYLNQLRIQSNISENVYEGYSIPYLIGKHKVTHMQCTPSMAQMLLMDEESQSSLSSLKTMLIGGETFPVKLAEKLVDLVKGDILNMYGPTETTVWSTLFKLEKPDGKTISIGKPIANTQTYIVDAYLQHVSTGIPGELCIGGDGVTSGYFNRPELTAEKFIDNPFQKSGSRIYRTGDLACYNEDGTIEFLGRLDHQVKIRGYRIELGEIETLLSAHPHIREAAVIGNQDTSSDVRLIAYIILRNGKSYDLSVIKDFLKEKIPEYMIPSQFVTIDAFPLTPNGKIDRKAFPVPTELAMGSDKDFIMPSNDLEEEIAAVWKDLLKLEKVGINDNFFDMGGHSLLAVQLHARLKQIIDPGLTLIDIFTCPTINSLEEFINKKLQPEEEVMPFQNSRRAVMSRNRISKLKTRNRDREDNTDI